MTTIQVSSAPNLIGTASPGTTSTSEKLKVADAVWVATALLHRKYPDHDDVGFSTEDIVSAVMRERLTESSERSVYQHVNQHCVANRKPMPNRIRMLYALGKGDRRLYRPGDKYAPEREGSQTKPDATSLPDRFKELLQWYVEWSGGASKQEPYDALLTLVGTGAAIWKDEHADAYIARLRAGWDGGL